MNQTMKHHTTMMFPRVLKIVQECGAMLEHMVSHFLCMPDARSRINQIQLLHDCATICETFSWVTNNGKEAKDFTSIIGGVSMKAIFKEEYEYNYTVTMIDGDLGTGSIKPLATKSGFVVIEVPDGVADSKESLVIKLEDQDKAQITLR